MINQSHSLLGGFHKYFCILFFVLFVAGAAQAQTVDLFTTQGAATWTAPDGVTSIQVEVWGAGGAGGSNAIGRYGAGGSGGNYIRVINFSVTPGVTYNFFVGAAGVGVSGGTNNGFGTAGGNSWFGSPATVMALGGQPGIPTPTSVSTSFGIAALAWDAKLNYPRTGYDATYKGGNGIEGRQQGLSNRPGGGGGSAGTDSNGMPADSTRPDGGDAVAGGGPGGNGYNGLVGNGSAPVSGPGGGGGAAACATNASFIGGNGANGQVRLTYNVSTCTPPAKPTASNQTFCSPEIVGDLVVTGAPGATFTWYEIPSGGVPLSNTELLLSKTYYVTQNTGCESEATAVDVTAFSAGKSIVNYNFNAASVSSFASFVPVLATDITVAITSSNAAAGSVIGSVTSVQAVNKGFTTNADANSIRSMLASSVTGGTTYYQFQLGGSALPDYSNFKLYFQANKALAQSQSIVVQYSTDGTNFTNFDTVFVMSSATSTGQVWPENVIDLTSVTAINNPSDLYFRLVFQNNASNQRIDNFQVLANKVSGCGNSLGVKAFIQGYYSGAGTMKTVLLNQAVPGALSNQSDTITIELRESTAPYNLFESHNAVLSIAGAATASVDAAALGNSYYIVLKHRNGVETWSAAPVTIAAFTSYDFTTAANMAYGDNQVEVESGVWAIYSGDLDQDGYITNFDYVPLETGILNFDEGYQSTDIDGDGYVTNFDYPVMEQNILNFIQLMRP